MEAASAKLAETLAQIRALAASTALLTDQLSAQQQQLKAEQASSQRLVQQLGSSQAECRQVLPSMPKTDCAAYINTSFCMQQSL